MIRPIPCQVLVEAIRCAGSLDGAQETVIFQWQDGKRVIVWPEELAPGKPRFPTPPWSQR